MTQEIYNPIPNYEGLYEVSNLGKIKSLIHDKSKILSASDNSLGYYKVVLFKNGKRKTFNVHQLVAMAFLNHNPCGHKLVVDHINNIKKDNRAENLQIITQRQNSHKTQLNYTSNYKGVFWDKESNKWRGQITIKNKKVYLGRFTNEYEAHLAYNKALENYLENDQSIQESKKTKTNVNQ
jgi:hypothetical protein